MKCPNCQFKNPQDSNFCGQCATPLTSPETGPDSSTATAEIITSELERRTVFAGRYEIIEELGKGGMGRVYRVEDNKINEEVALKVLKPEISLDKNTIERFRNELKFARKIAHKNVCKMYDLNEEGTIHYITMEYVPGENLKNMIRMSRQLSSATAVSITRQICEGLAEAHNLGVVHRDLKPGNIMIDRSGNARIMDFGIARFLETRGLTKAGVLIGTPEYTSPEQVEGKKADQRADIYSLGVTLYEMVTGRLPFEGDTPLSIAVKHKTEEPPDPRHFNTLISEDLCRIILKCMEKEKEKRYQGAEELLSELNKMERETPLPEKYITPRTQAPEKMSTIKWKKILPYGGGVIILILLIVAGITLFPGRLGTIDSIAVLPFQNVDRYSYSEYLTDGITESIISKLAQLPGLKKVIARSSVFRYKGKEINPQVVGRELGVDTVFVSRMSRRGDELTISVELIRVRDNSQIWGKRYTRNISEIFAVQDEITNSITDNLRLRLTGAELERMRKRYTEKTDAFIAYTKGRYFWNKRTQVDLERAIEYFEQALLIDPNYALAYTGLSFSYLLLPEYGTYRPEEVYPKSKEASLKALEIDDLLSEARVALAQILRRLEYNWPGAEREYKRALELDPNNATAHHWYGYDLMCVGQFEKGIKEIRRALELDPLSLVTNRNLGQALYRARRYGEALAILQTTLEMDPTFSATHLYIGSIYLQQGKYEDALVEFQKEKGNAKGWSVRIDAWIGVTYARMGEKEKTRAILDDLLRKSEHIYISHTLLAMLYFELGEDDQGFQMLDRAYEELDTWMRLLKTDPIFDRVSSDPRFKAMLKKAGLGD